MDTDIAVPFADDSTEDDEDQDADSVFCTGRLSEHHNGEDCAKCVRWVHTLCDGMEGDLVCEPVMDKHCFVLSLYPLYLIFFCIL